MAGKLLGLFAKSVMTSLLAGDVLFPEYKERVDKSKDDEWVDWDEYCEMTREIAKQMSPVVMRKIGRDIIYEGRKQFFDLGYKHIDDIILNYTEFFSKVVKDLPEGRETVLVSGEPGRAIIHYNKDQPEPLIHGVIQGLFKAYDTSFESISIKDIGEKFEVDIRY